MRSSLVLFASLIFVLAASPSEAQSRGGAMGASRSGGRPGNSVSAGPVGSRAQIASGQSQTTIQRSMRTDPRHWTAAGVAVPPSFGHSPLSVATARLRRHFHPHHLHHHRFFHHRHHFFHRPRGIVIIDVPGFFGTSVATHVLPGSRWMEQPLTTGPLADSRVRIQSQLAPFDPMPQEVVERLLSLAEVKPSDVVYDLGTGDGRVVISAATKYGARGVGFEIDSGLVKLARENVRKVGVEELVQIRQQDFMTADLSAATVVTLYLSREANEAIKPLLLKQLKAGARVVSYSFDMGDWTPKIIESYRDAAGDTHLFYYWEIAVPAGLS
jgi:predicted RNA methylase